jgi:peptidoglycan/LPS O-acetylase OafA/YrhL
MSNSLWSRYKDALDVKADIRAVFFRRHERHATLDGARAITVLLMVLFHVLFGIVVLFDDNAVYIDQFISNFPRYLGWMWQSQGSDPLFLMCGLLVSATLFREYDKKQSIDIPRFYKRRLIRVVPLFVVALLIYGPLDKDNIENLWSNLIFMSNYIQGERHIVPVGWSLDVQLHFYLLLPFLVLMMYGVRWRIAFLVALCVASVAWRYYIVARAPDIYTTPFYQIIYDGDFGSLLADQLYYDLDVRVGAFFLGMLVAYLHHYYAGPIKSFLARHWVLNTSLVLSGFTLIAASLSLPVENRNADFYQQFDANMNFWFLVADRYIYSLGLSILLLMAMCPAGISRGLEWLLSWKVWHPVAQLIFPIYLFHFVFIVIAAMLTFYTTDRSVITQVHTYQVFLLYFWTVVLTMGFSTIVHAYIEKPFLTLRDKKPSQENFRLPSTVIAAEKAEYTN